MAKRKTEEMKQEDLLKSISVNCELCNGRCWNSDPAIRQHNAYKMFGIIPNACVDSEADGPQCPYMPKKK